MKTTILGVVLAAGLLARRKANDAARRLARNHFDELPADIVAIRWCVDGPCGSQSFQSTGVDPEGRERLLLVTHRNRIDGPCQK